MLTIFTIPKPFIGHIGVIQRNAIKSWLNLVPECEIILFGDEPGIQEIAQEFEIMHVPEIRKTPSSHSTVARSAPEIPFDYNIHLPNKIFKKIFPHFGGKFAKNNILARHLIGFYDIQNLERNHIFTNEPIA